MEPSFPRICSSEASRTYPKKISILRGISRFCRILLKTLISWLTVYSQSMPKHITSSGIGILRQGLYDGNHLKGLGQSMARHC